MNTLKNCLEKLNDLETSISEYLTKLNIDISNIEIDHLGMKFTDQAEVIGIISELESSGAVMISSVVMKGREFRIFKLKNPISFLGKQVYGIELPDIKPGAIRKRIGFEHVEFCFNQHLKTADELEDFFLKSFSNFNKDYTYKIEVPAVDNQLPNPTLVFENIEEEFEIKFHPMSIFEVVKGE